MAPENVEILLAKRPAKGPVRKRSYLPALRTIFYTLDISLRFLARLAIGRGTLKSADALLAGYWKRIFRAGNASLEASGRAHFLRGQSYVVMSNHASILDIPALMGATPGSMRMVMKEELSRVPIWGPALVASGFVPIDRKDRQKAIGQLEKAKQQLTGGVNIWISPEGTRSRNGKLAPFKKGGFHLAMDLGVPIVPTWIEGAQYIIPPDQFIAIFDGTCTVRFGTPIPTAARSREELPALMAEVRAAIVALAGDEALASEALGQVAPRTLEAAAPLAP